MTVDVLLLGAAQDAGLPQPGCDCLNCRRAWSDPTLAEDPVALALIDHEVGAAWLIDCTPAFPRQLHRLTAHAPDCTLSGIFLTHAHMGHYTGLIYLGREAMNTVQLPVYATASAARFLQGNGPWSQLVALENVVLRTVEPDSTLRLSDGLSVTALAVPHRAEFSDTVAYLIRGRRDSLFYCPDIDSWQAAPFVLKTLVDSVTYALLDGTFFDAAELPGRDLRTIPHPLVRDTCALLAGTSGAVTFIHLNHSNPLWRAGDERRWLTEQGYAVGRSGMVWRLA